MNKNLKTLPNLRLPNQAYPTHLLSVRGLVDRLEVPLRPLGVAVLGKGGRGRGSGGGGGNGGRGAGGAHVVASERQIWISGFPI